jgi:signal transduction histidine kinase
VSVSRFEPTEPARIAVARVQGRSDAVEVQVAQSNDLPRFMSSDEKKITKILAALLDNAYKFTHKGHVRVNTQTSGGRIIYTVEDTGIGIPLEAQRYVFDEFRQVDGSATRRYGGSGLGLSLARRLARLLGGDIVLVSMPGIGSTFRVEVPIEYTTAE